MILLKGVKDSIDIKVTANIDTDNGRTLKVPFIITAKKPTTKEQRDIGNALRDDRMTDDQLIAEFLMGWKGLQGADGNDVPFNDETLEMVLDAPEYRAAIQRGIKEALLGKEALAKN